MFLLESSYNLFHTVDFVEKKKKKLYIPYTLTEIIEINKSNCMPPIK